MSGTEVSVTRDGVDELRAVSDGVGNYTVSGRGLRNTGQKPHEVKTYQTTDDLRVLGEVVRCLAAFYGHEAIKAALLTREGIADAPTSPGIPGWIAEDPDYLKARLDEAIARNDEVDIRRYSERLDIARRTT